MSKYITNSKTYSQVVKTKKRISPSKKTKSKKVNPFLVSKSIIKFKKGLTKNKSKQQSLEPLIFIIQGHSGSCFLKDMDLNIYSGTLKPIHFLEKASNKYPKKRTQIIKDIEKLRTYDIKNIFCHKYSIICNKKALYFCEECLNDTKGKKYFWCEDCNYYLHNDLGKELHKSIKFNNRIDIDNEFKFKDEKIKILMAQSSGRAGLIKTGFVMLEEYEKYRKPLSDLLNTKPSNIKEIQKQIKNLNILTNRVNPKIQKLHKNKMDTDFRIYPRINEEKYQDKGKTKTKKRYIPGPIDTSINFNINSNIDQINGVHWPLGIYSYNDFMPYLYNLLFKNIDKDTQFFNTIKEYKGNLVKVKQNFKRGLLLGLNNLPSEFKDNADIKEDHEYYQDFLNLEKNKDDFGFSTKKLEKNKKGEYTSEKAFHINRYNQYLYENVFNKDNQFKTKINLRDIIYNILNYHGYFKKNRRKKSDVIFVINQCRNIIPEKNNIPLGDLYNQTQDPRTINYFTAQRENSNRA
tara:strand:- start:592 stop:2145 length:1554 start_codon:yes stop_codon:yes gene_type:complete